MKTRLILDSGLVDEYKECATLAKQHGVELWGATTNPSLIAKNVSDAKMSRSDADTLHRDVILQLVELVPGAVSAEVYADEKTSPEDMVKQGQEIAAWHERVAVKLPTTLKGFTARTELRKLGIMTNNTLVFSQKQIFAICLHEHILQTHINVQKPVFPPFISPFVGRLDDKGINGMDLVKHGMRLKKLFPTELWMLEASVRNLTHLHKGFALESELITAPLKIYKEYFSKQNDPSDNTSLSLAEIPYWEPERDLVGLSTIDDFMSALTNGRLNIHHELTNAGITRFANDWNAIIQE